VYSAGSNGVEPPIGIRPQLARELPTALKPEDLARVELVIGTDGSIESARLLDPPRNVIDSLVVSAAKAWSFEPAMKDGHPVRYRKTVWVRSR
jgi:TonB family protein